MESEMQIFEVIAIFDPHKIVSDALYQQVTQIKLYNFLQNAHFNLFTYHASNSNKS